MKPTDSLVEFTRAGLAGGHDAPVLRQAMTRAGWTEREIVEALAAWEPQPGLPPVPRPRSYVSAREALLYGLLFLSLGMLAWHLVQLGFQIIEQVVPDLTDRSGPPAAASRWSMAALITFTPLFLWLNRRVNRDTADDPGRRRSLVRKWFASVTLLIALLTLLGDTVTTIYALLNGDLTMRFLTKALLVAAIAGLVIAYYRDEMDD